MKTGLDLIAEISHKYGSNEKYVLAGGGNTSYKDEKYLYIKGSGTALATIENSEFVKLSRDKLAKIWEKEFSWNKDERESEVLKDMMDARCEGEENKRPSVETLLHNLFSQSYILHVHPTLVNGLTCSNNGSKIVSEIFPDAIWINETEPGYILASHCRKEISDYEKKTGKKANILFLQNHGIFFAGNSGEEIDNLVDSVISKLDQMATITPNMEKVQYNLENIENVKEVLKGVFGEEKAIKFTLNKEVEKLAKSQKEFSVLLRPMTPDHIVYCKSEPLFLNNLSTSYVSERLDNFVARNKFEPKVIFVKDIGMFAIGNSEKDAETVTKVWLDAIKISVYATNFGGIRPMAEDMVDFIVNWEVESYRSKVAMK